MNRLAIGGLTAAFLFASPALAEEMTVTPNGAQSSIVGSAEYFTGTAVVDPLFAPNGVRGSSAGHVTFAPGARSAWHSHPAGQTLVVTSGSGWIQQWDGEKREIKAGDVVWTPPGVKHWHGATSTTSMGHIAFQEIVDGSAVEWMEQVSDEDYDG